MKRNDRIQAAFASGQSGQAWGLRRLAWAFFAVGRAGLWASVRLSWPIWPGLAGLQISAGFRVIR